MSKGTIHFISTDPRFCGNQDQVRQFSGYRDTITCLDCLAPKPLAFNIDRANSDDKRLYVGIPSRGMTAAIIITDEGVIVDLQVDNKLLASTHALTADAMGDES